MVGLEQTLDIIKNQKLMKNTFLSMYDKCHVIQCLPSLVKVKNLHGKFGMYLKKQQRCPKNLAIYQKLYQMMINKFLSSLLSFYMIDQLQ